ncbi:MAG: type III PLP-dependent enzyme [Planctomycetota bacterium]|jgi:ornithine decarboxylase
MVAKRTLERLAKEHGTPLFVVDHKVIRKNYADLCRLLPRVQAYFAVKANPDPEIVRTIYEIGGSFDVASMPEFDIVYANIADMPAKERQHWIWDRIIYSHPIKTRETLRQLDGYKPLVSYDNLAEVGKIAEHAPHAGLVLRLQVPNTGSMVELSTKFGCPPGDAVDLIEAAHAAGLTVEGLCFHVGSQCTNFENYVQALHVSADVFREAKSRGYELTLLDIGGGFPAPYDENVRPFRALAKRLNSELERLFPESIEVIAEPGRSIVATAATLVAEVIGKAVRNGKLCYYINDGIYHTYSGILFDHCRYHVKAFRAGERRICSVFGPTCDALDKISLAEELPRLDVGDLVYTENIGAYSTASATHFNGFPPPKVVHVNR